MFTFSGIASGLDTGSIIRQLVALERIPIQRLQERKAGEKAKLDLVETLRKHVKALQDASGELRTMASFLSFEARAGVEGVAAFEVSGSASPGSHTLRVLSLAQVDRWAFDAVSDDLQQLAGGTGESIRFSVDGTDYEVEIDPAQSNIHQVASTINSQAGAAVAATVVNTGTASAPSYQLVLTSKGSGSDLRISDLESTVSGLSIDATGPDSEGQAQSSNHITVGQNAVAIVDGLRVERSTNKIDGVLAGVTIDLLSTHAGEELSFTVSADTAAIKGRVEKLVSAYNQVVSFINGQNQFNEESGPGGRLFGDSILGRVRREISAALFDLPASQTLSGDEGYSALHMVGIKVDNTGQLSIDHGVFDAKLASNLDALADLFVDRDGFDNGGAEPNTPGYHQDTTADAGIAERIHRAIARMFDTISSSEGPPLKGLFDSRVEALSAVMKRYDRQIDQRELHLERFEIGLVKRFAALEQLMGSLNAQGAALNSALLALQPRRNT